MTAYSFESLSGYEFEKVVRDLLQAELSMPFQSGPPGKDGGIDLRSKVGDSVVLAQCKQYARSGVATLLNRLERDEVAKVKQLNPTRYLLVTSLSLTHENRRKIAALFAPFCKSEHDVLGADDLDQLLANHPSVADRHIKLWLTSEPVLRRVLLSKIFDDSELELERIRRRLALYVSNPSLGRARAVLEREHVCVISGLPGIGKTTLAQVLLAKYESEGFQVIRVPNKLSQVIGSARRGSKAVFYFDDFLGQTVFERLERNEDQRLTEFMESVKHEPGWRFILTTREYILEQARLSSEALARLSLSDRSCVITLDKDYTPTLRARILYQHLYFSDLPEAHVLALLGSGNLKKVLLHRNYSPRLISLLTSKEHGYPATSKDYPIEFLTTFENPERLWDVAFRAMDGSVQDLAIAMVTLPPSVRLSHLLEAYESFRAQRVKRLNVTRTPSEFTDALRVLDGTMLRTDKKKGTQILVAFHNPSVRDFLQSRLVQQPMDVHDLVDSAVFFDQCAALFEGAGSEPYPAIQDRPDAFAQAVSRTINSVSTRLSAVQAWTGLAVDAPSSELSPPTKARFLFDIAKQLDTPDAASLRDQQFGIVEALALSGQPIHVSDTGAFLRHVYLQGDRSLDLDQVVVQNQPTTLAALLLDRVVESVLESEDESEMLLMANLLADFPALQSDDRLDSARQVVRRFGEGILESWFSPETRAIYDDAAAATEKAGELLRYDTGDLVQKLRDRADRVSADREEEPEPDYDDDARREAYIDTNALFERLENEIRGRQG